MTTRRRVRITVRGVVQGVGFRPFVYTTAAALGLAGSVRNDSSGAIIEVEGGDHDIGDFLDRLRHQAPPLAIVESVQTREIPLIGGTGSLGNNRSLQRSQHWEAKALRKSSWRRRRCSATMRYRKQILRSGRQKRER